MNAPAPGSHVQRSTIPAALTAALVVNVLLVIVIHHMSSPAKGALPDRRFRQVVDFVRLRPAARELVPHRRALPPSPLPPPRPPLPPPESVAATAAPAVPPSPVPMPVLELPAEAPGSPALGVAASEAPGAVLPVGPAGPVAGRGTGAGGAGQGRGSAAAAGSPEIEYGLVPIDKTPPRYPRRALRDGVEGVVTVEFVIDAGGRVRNPRIVAADPPGIFEATVMKVIGTWTFPPKYVDGQAVERIARQNVTFSLQRR